MRVMSLLLGFLAIAGLSMAPAATAPDQAVFSRDLGKECVSARALATKIAEGSSGIEDSKPPKV